MAKRFTDTNKYKKPFIRSLQAPYKLLWDYLYHECDHAGIWIVDFEIAQIYIGKDAPIDYAQALEVFNSGETRIVELENGAKWWVKPFVDFQNGELNPANRVHNSIIQILKKYNLIDVENKPLTRGLQGAKDIYKVKDKDIDTKKGEFEGKTIELNEQVGLPEMEVEKFNLYWTQIAPKGKKMHYEKQETFDHAARMRTWKLNGYGSDKTKNRKVKGESSSRKSDYTKTFKDVQPRSTAN